MPSPISRALPIVLTLVMLAGLAPGLQRPLIADLALVATVRTYHLQKESCQPSALVSGAAPVTGVVERLGIIIGGATTPPDDVTLEFSAQDLVFDETWALQLRDLGGDFGPQVTHQVPSPIYLRFWSNASARVIVQTPPGCYQVTIFGMEGTPGPVWLKVFANHQPLGDLWFCRSDNSWSAQSLIVTPSFWLLSGEPDNELLLDLAFANDGPDERGLRDAGVAQVNIHTISCTGATQP